MPNAARPKTQNWHLFVPKLVIALREGYGAASLRKDFLAGLTVAIVALPLSMALAIASGVAPERGLFTAIVGGALISLLGGVRHQIGGPAGAFVVIIAGVVERYGYEGLVVATMMAGAILIVAGLMRLGTFIKYIPHPVVAGFTAGIAVIIFSTQVGEVLGLRLAETPADVPGKWLAYLTHLDAIDPMTTAIAALTLATILIVRRYRPEWPAFLIAVALASAVTAILGLDIETVGTRFGGIPSSLPLPDVPMIDGAMIRALLPDAFTIAFLAGVESLLCAVVADGMTGRRHHSNLELVAQGAANFSSAVMGGVPVTGTIARTATNIRAGATSPIAGLAHAGFLLLFVLTLSPLASTMPLASLGAVLLVVAYNMGEWRTLAAMWRAPSGDRALLASTLILTVFVDLTLAIEVGVVLAAMLFMHRMALAVEQSTASTLIQEDVDDFAAPRPDAIAREMLPADVEIFQINGPFFFGAANVLADRLGEMRKAPRLFVLRMDRVPLIDASGVHALTTFIRDAGRRGTQIVLLGVTPNVEETLTAMGVTARRAASLAEALAGPQN